MSNLPKVWIPAGAEMSGRRAAGARHRPHFLSGPGQAGIPAPPLTRGQACCAPRTRGAERRETREGCAPSLGGLARPPGTLARRAPSACAAEGRLPALHGGDFCPRAGASWDEAKRASPSPAELPAERSSCRPDRSPGPPGCEGANLARGRRTHPALKTPHENAPRLGGMARLIVYVRIKVKGARINC